MKKIPFLLVTIFAFILMSAGSSKHEISLKNNILKLDGQILSNGWQFSLADQKLGASGRITDGENILHTYDNSGVLIMEEKFNNSASGKITEIQFHLQKNVSDSAAPKSVFTGKISLEGYKLDRSLIMAELREKLKPVLLEVETQIPHTLKYMRGDIYIYFSFNEKDSDLISVSFAPISAK